MSLTGLDKAPDSQASMIKRTPVPWKHVIASWPARIPSLTQILGLLLQGLQTDPASMHAHAAQGCYQHHGVPMYNTHWGRSHPRAVLAPSAVSASAPPPAVQAESAVSQGVALAPPVMVNSCTGRVSLTRPVSCPCC
jgi:hypothetical protein